MINSILILINHFLEKYINFFKNLYKNNDILNNKIKKLLFNFNKLFYKNNVESIDSILINEKIKYNKILKYIYLINNYIIENVENIYILNNFFIKNLVNIYY